MILNKIQSTVKVVQSFSRNERALVAKSQNGVSVSMCQCRVQSGGSRTKRRRLFWEINEGLFLSRYIHAHSLQFFWGLTMYKIKRFFLKKFAGHF